MSAGYHFSPAEYSSSTIFLYCSSDISFGTYVFNFSFDSKGSHRETRTGGQAGRNEIQRFFNIFLGKLGEVATFNYFIKNNVNLKTKVDYEIRERGQWDDCDMVTKDNKYISIISIKY